MDANAHLFKSYNLEVFANNVVPNNADAMITRLTFFHKKTSKKVLQIYTTICLDYLTTNLVIQNFNRFIYLYSCAIEL